MTIQQEALEIDILRQVVLFIQPIVHIHKDRVVKPIAAQQVMDGLGLRSFGLKVEKETQLTGEQSVCLFDKAFPHVKFQTAIGASGRIHIQQHLERRMEGALAKDRRRIPPRQTTGHTLRQQHLLATPFGHNAPYFPLLLRFLTGR